MIYGYMHGKEQPNCTLRVKEGQVVAGHSIGIVVLNTHQPFVPGNVVNATTFRFPVLYEPLDDLESRKILSGDPSLLPSILRAAKRLEQQGVRAVVGGCGYFGYYQREVSSALDVPVFLSSLLQLPAILSALRKDKRVGILCADAGSLSEALLDGCGFHEISRIAIAGAEKLPEFGKMLLDTGEANSSVVEHELVGLARDLVRRNPDVAALLLECSDFPPYAWAIQNAVALTVYDYTTMINWIHEAVVRYPFTGYL